MTLGGYPLPRRNRAFAQRHKSPQSVAEPKLVDTIGSRRQIVAQSDSHWFYVAKFKNRKKKSIRPAGIAGALIFVACILGFVVGASIIFLADSLAVRAFGVLSMILSSSVFIYGIVWKTDKNRPPQ